LRLGTSGSLSAMEGPGVQVGIAVDDRATAFRNLVGPALDDAYRRATVLLGDRFEAEDAVHDAAEKAWRSWGSLREPARFDAWFGRILVNTCRDRLRARRRVRRIEVAGDLDADPAAPDRTNRIDDVGRVGEALAVLTPDERIVVVLRFEADLTVPTIAALVGAPEGTVKARLHHALRKVRAALEGGAS
jgi:RNA polymerase sigma factor (sigma-70 family)